MMIYLVGVIVSGICAMFGYGYKRGYTGGISEDDFYKAYVVIVFWPLFLAFVPFYLIYKFGEYFGRKMKNEIEKYID